jgi:hypothetical protein
MAIDQDILITKQQAAKMLNIHTRTFDYHRPHWQAKYGLQVIRIGRSVRFFKQSVLDMIDAAYESGDTL